LGGGGGVTEKQIHCILCETTSGLASDLGNYRIKNIEKERVFVVSQQKWLESKGVWPQVHALLFLFLRYILGFCLLVRSARRAEYRKKKNHEIGIAYPISFRSAAPWPASQVPLNLLHRCIVLPRPGHYKKAKTSPSKWFFIPYQAPDYDYPTMIY